VVIMATKVTEDKFGEAMRPYGGPAVPPAREGD
jgi:hypothetical protein